MSLTITNGLSISGLIISFGRRSVLEHSCCWSLSFVRSFLLSIWYFSALINFRKQYCFFSFSLVYLSSLLYFSFVLGSHGLLMTTIEYSPPLYWHFYPHCRHFASCFMQEKNNTNFCHFTLTLRNRSIETLPRWIFFSSYHDSC